MVSYDKALNAKYGAGQWHCDDLWAAKTLPACVQSYLDVARASPHERLEGAPALYATHNGKRVRVVMASRFGDVGISKNLTKRHGYDSRVLLPDLTDFSDTP